MTNQTEAHAEAILRAAVPVAYRYDCIKAVGDRKHLDPSFFTAKRANMNPCYWTETPLYPPSAILDAVREAMGQERAAIVAWLRASAERDLEGATACRTGNAGQTLRRFAQRRRGDADAIERGEHITLATGDKQP